MSSSPSVQSSTWAFSTMRSRLRDLGIVGTPCCRHQRTSTWAAGPADAPGDLRDRRVAQQAPVPKRAVGLQHDAEVPVGPQLGGRPDLRVPLDLVDHRRHLRPLDRPAQEVGAVVGDADRAGETRRRAGARAPARGPRRRARASGSGRGRPGRARACGGWSRAGGAPRRGRGGAWSPRTRRPAAARSRAGPARRPPRCRRRRPCQRAGSPPRAPRGRPARSPPPGPATRPARAAASGRRWTAGARALRPSSSWGADPLVMGSPPVVGYRNTVGLLPRARPTQVDHRRCW